MSHCIEGYIADYDKLKEVASQYQNAYVVRLNANNLGFLPLINDFFDELYNKTKSSYLRTRRLGFPISLIRTDYFGGFGEQSANLISGYTTPLKKGTINEALKLLGVKETKDKDEFDVVGLGKYRTNEDWVGLEEGFHPPSEQR